MKSVSARCYSINPEEEGFINNLKILIEKIKNNSYDCDKVGFFDLIKLKIPKKKYIKYAYLTVEIVDRKTNQLITSISSECTDTRKEKIEVQFAFIFPFNADKWAFKLSIYQNTVKSAVNSEILTSITLNNDEIDRISNIGLMEIKSTVIEVCDIWERFGAANILYRLSFIDWRETFYECIIEMDDLVVEQSILLKFMSKVFVNEILKDIEKHRSQHAEYNSPKVQDSAEGRRRSFKKIFGDKKPSDKTGISKEDKKPNVQKNLINSFFYKLSHEVSAIRGEIKQKSLGISKLAQDYLKEKKHKNDGNNEENETFKNGGENIY